ncbi:MAG: hypothetical protein GF417_09805 [Candidatus Latescibacteria bacterium]|nr:hypothetical protein [bacterium]MBD3424720.1 hypothetical protein [Candidatus Latescibacterota bacterium]
MKKGLSIAALVIIVVVIIGFILIMVNKDRLVNMAVTRAVDSIETATLKSDQLPISKEQAEALFDRTRQKIKAGEMSQEKARELINRFREFYDDKKLDSEEIQKLIDTLESAAK